MNNDMLPTNDEVYTAVCKARGNSTLYVSTNAVNDVMAAVRALATSAAHNPDELHFNAQRLRNVAELAGCAILPEVDDAEVDDLRGAFLGIIASKLRESAAAPERPAHLATENNGEDCVALAPERSGKLAYVEEAVLLDIIGKHCSDWKALRDVPNKALLRLMNDAIKAEQSRLAAPADSGSKSSLYQVAGIGDGLPIRWYDVDEMQYLSVAPQQRRIVEVTSAPDESKGIQHEARVEQADSSSAAPSEACTHRYAHSPKEGHAVCEFCGEEFKEAAPAPTGESLSADTDTGIVGWAYEQFHEFSDSRNFKPHWERAFSWFKPEPGFPGSFGQYRNAKPVFYRVALATPRQTEDGGLSAAVDIAYPKPDSHHGSVIQHAKDNRIAFARGWNAALASSIASTFAPKEPAAQGCVLEITDDQMIGVLHSFGIDTKLSVYGFDALQVAGTNVPGIKGIVRMCIACIQSGVWPAPRYSFDSSGNVVRASLAAPTGDHP